MMRSLIACVCALIGTTFAPAGDLAFSKQVRASLVFHDDFDNTRRYPHLLKVYLCLENIHDSSVSWVADATTGVEAELFDAAGKPVPQGPQAGSISSNAYPLQLPYGSRLEWLVSHGGISLMGDAKNHYALMIGGKGWLIPLTTAETYSLKIRLRGSTRTGAAQRASLDLSELLFDLPACPLRVTPSPAPPGTPR